MVKKNCPVCKHIDVKENVIRLTDNVKKVHLLGICDNCSNVYEFKILAQGEE